jgi:carbon storage regulator CsrA
MLCLNLNQGEYMTIGEDVVVQVDGITGDRCKLVIQAPKEVPILRGAVLERGGGQRPSCVFDAPRGHRKELIWDQSKAQALTAMRTLLGQMDGTDSNVRTLRRQLNHMFPPQTEAAEQNTKVSNG